MINSLLSHDPQTISSAISSFNRASVFEELFLTPNIQSLVHVKPFLVWDISFNLLKNVIITKNKEEKSTNLLPVQLTQPPNYYSAQVITCLFLSNPFFSRRVKTDSLTMPPTFYVCPSDVVSSEHVWWPEISSGPQQLCLSVLSHTASVAVGLPE